MFAVLKNGKFLFENKLYCFQNINDFSDLNDFNANLNLKCLQRLAFRHIGTFLQGSCLDGDINTVK